MMKILLFPLVAGLSYELLKLAGKSDGPVITALSYPGLQLQRLTTKEPDDQQLEVAIEAMKAVLATEPSEAIVSDVTEEVTNEAH